MRARHLISVSDLSREDLEDLLRLAREIQADRGRFMRACEGKLMASLFFEPSTRTKFSFDAAMIRLGGSTMGFADPASTSASKGESLADTVRVISSYADIIVTRSPKEGAALLMSRNSSCPVVNAGDGGHEHPTQTLTDLFTLLELKGRLGGLRFGLCGDLKFGRTHHSLVKALRLFPDNRFTFISTDELRMPQEVLDGLDDGSWTQTASLEGAMPGLDVLYMSRVQRERFVSEDEYVRLKDLYVLDREKMRLAGPDMIVMHPLPRTGEIDPQVDDDPRAVYFRQAANGVPVRMALIMALLGIGEDA